MKKRIPVWAIALILIIFIATGLKVDKGGNISAVAAEPTPTGSVVPTGTPVPTAAPTASPTPTPVIQGLMPTATPMPEKAPELVKIQAQYNGPVVEVGEKFDKKYVQVVAVYSDNSMEKLEHYIISGEVVEQEGPNTFVVIYNRLTTEFIVKGKEIQSISAICNLNNIGIGNMPDARDMYVVAVYTDGSIQQIKKGFKISPEVIKDTGVQEITIVYKDHMTTCKIVGMERDKLMTLTVSSNIENLPVGVNLDRDDLTVMAVYADGKAERITTYELSKTQFAEVGSHLVKVYYGGRSTEFKVEVVERNPVSMWANYTGGKVMVGRNFLKSEMHVYIVYENGEEVEVDNYTYHSARARYVGENILELFYGSTLSTTVLIEGTAIEKPSFDYTSTLSMTNGKQKASMEVALPVYLKEDAVYSKSIKKSVMKKAFKKVGVTEGEYIAFTFDFTNVDDEIELPLDVRITIPKDFDITHTFLYYTPNRKTILGRTNKTVIDDRTFEVTLFKTGTYMLVYSDEFDRQLTDEELGEEDSDYL